MGNDDRIVEIHKAIGEMSSDIKWIVQSRKEDMERITQYNLGKRNFKTYAVVIAVPVLISMGVFMSGLTKNVDILVALHKPQMEMFVKPNPHTGGLLPSGVTHGN